MVSLSLGQIAEQAGVRPPGSSSNWKSRSSGEETPGTAAGIASGYARSRVPKILEPAPVTGSASSGSTVGLAAPAPQAERSASATDLYERAIRGAELGGRTHQQHGSDPVRPVARSTSTPPDERSSAPAPSQQQQHGQEQVQQHEQTRAASPHLQPPQSGHVNFSQQPSRVAQRDGAAARQSSSGQGSDNSPNSDPSPGSHASTSIIPEHHRVYTTPYMSPNQPGPYGRGMPQAGPGSSGHFSASSSPSYIQHHHQQQNASYAYHTQYYAPQYHYPPPNDGSQAYYAVNNAGSPHSPIHDPQAGMAPQTFYPQTYYYSTGQVLHTGASSPNSAAALTLDDGTLSHHAYSDDMSNSHHARPFSAQSAHQPFGQQSHHQQHQQHPHAQQRLQAGLPYQVSHQPGMPYVTYTSGHPSGNQMMGSAQLLNPSYAQPQYQYQPMNNPPMSPILGHTYTYNQQGNHRPSVDMGQHQYHPVQFSPVSPQAFTSPPLGGGGAGGQQHLRYSTVDSAFSASTSYTNMEQSSAQPSAYPAQGSRGATNVQSSQRPTELARGHLAQSKFREALGAYDPNARLPISANEHKRAASGDSRLPKPPSHSPWAMWVGNVPSDATHSELWRFFSSRPPPGKPIPDSEEEKETLASEALYTAPDDSQPDYDTVGIESVHLISRSNCCFVNMASKRHLDHAIKVSHGLSLRPHDPRCKPLVCRIRKKDDDNKTGVGAQRGKGMHQAWAAEKEKVKGLADAEAEIAAIVTGDAPSAVSIAVGSDGQLGHNGSASTIHSNSTSSTTSTFLTRHFPRRYFILKSHSEDDLHMSVERGLWATQSHNEPVLDQAYRTAQSVFLIFGANKSGEFFGYAKMAGPIHKLEKRSSRSSSLGQEIEGSSSSGGKSGSSGSRRPEPSIAETPEDETTEDVQSPPNLSVPSVQYVLSPSGVVSNSPQPLSTADTPAQAKLAEDDVDYLSVKAPQHFTAPSPVMGEKGALEARKAESLDPSVLTRLASVGISERDRNSDPQRLSSSPLGMAIASKNANDQLLAGSSSRPGQEDEGVFRKDTLLSPEERNARLEMLETQQDAGHTALAPNGETSLKDAMEQGTSKPFKIEWIRVQKLPFYRTRHLRNAFNGNREVKISRDGTEIEPDVGQQLLELFWKDPALNTSQPTSPRTKSTTMISPMLS